MVIILIPTASAADSLDTVHNLAVGLGFAKDGIQLEFIIRKTLTQSLHIAVASNMLWDGAMGDEKESQLANYGKTVEGTGDGFYLFDIGWGYTFDSRIRLAGEWTFAWDYEFTNYIDARFSDGGYHIVDDRAFQLGGGMTISYILAKRYELYSGYNSYKKFNAGMRFGL